MALDASDRKQLIEARENIESQLMRLEGAAMDPFSGNGLQGRGVDYQHVYAELQRELAEINDLLEQNAGTGNSDPPEVATSYYPLSTVKIPQFPRKPSLLIILPPVFGLLWLAFVFIRTLVAG